MESKYIKVLKSNQDNEQIILKEDELLNIIDSNKKEFITKKHKLITEFYHELVSNFPEKLGVLDIENMGITYKNGALLLTPFNLMLELAQMLGFTENEINKLLASSNYNELYQKTMTILKNKINSIKEVETLEDLEQYDKEIYNYIKEGNIKESRLKYEVKTIRKSVLEEMKSIYNIMNNLFIKGDLNVTNKLVNYLNPQKLQLLLNVKRLKTITNYEKINEDEVLQIMKSLTSYYATTFKDKNNLIINVDDDLYTIDDYKSDYQNILNRLLADPNYKEKISHLFNQYLLADIRGLISDDTNFISKNWQIEESNANYNPKEVKYEIDKNSLLQQKKELFETTNYMYRIKGVNKMANYYGYIYENGKVIFEKYYTNDTEDNPAINEAIYLMNIDNFFILINLSKTSIMQYINGENKENVKRIYHAGNWMDKVKEEINAKTNYNSISVDIVIRQKIIEQQIEDLKEVKNMLHNLQSEQFKCDNVSIIHNK